MPPEKIYTKKVYPAKAEAIQQTLNKKELKTSKIRLLTFAFCTKSNASKVAGIYRPIETSITSIT